MSRVIVFVSAALACVSCVSGPDLEVPVIDAPDSFLTTVEVAAESNNEIWWRGFGDPALEELIEQALENNFQIAEANAGLNRTLALVRANQADLFPSLDAFVDTQLSGSSSDGGQAEGALSAGGIFGFDPDISGRNKRRIQAAESTAQAALFQRENIVRLIAETVALEYVELKQADARLDLLATSLELQERTLEIVTARFEAGLSPALDVDRSASDLARTRAQEGRLIANRREALYTLSVLTGQPPSAEGVGGAKTGNIPRILAGPQIGVPADALRNRPDLKAAEATLIAELARIGVEEADLYPSLRFPGQISARAAVSGNPSEIISASLSSVLDLPIFDGGRRRAEVDAQRATAEAATAVYRSAVLNVLLEVENALILIEARQRQLADLNEAVARGESAYLQLDALYREGLASFIDVLDAQRNLISSREAVVDTQADISSATIQLYASLGLRVEDMEQ